MKNSFKILTVILGLSVIALAFNFMRANKVEASVTEGQKFGDWQVTCTKTETPDKNSKDKKAAGTDNKACTLTQTLMIKKEDKKDDKQESQPEVLAIYQIGYMGADKKLHLLSIVPHNVNIASGVKILSAKKILISGQFTLSTPIGCRADIDVSDKDLEVLLQSKDNVFAYLNMNGEQVNYPISVQGLKDGLKALK